MPIANIAHKDSIGDLTEKSTDKQIRANKQVRKEYGDLLDMYPDHPVVIEMREEGNTQRVIRWKSNSIVRLMIDNYVDLNDLWKEFCERKLNIEDMATVYRMMGYSLCGFIEVFGDALHLYGEEE